MINSIKKALACHHLVNTPLIYFKYKTQNLKYKLNLKYKTRNTKKYQIQNLKYKMISSIKMASAGHHLVNPRPLYFEHPHISLLIHFPQLAERKFKEKKTNKKTFTKTITRTNTKTITFREQLKELSQFLATIETLVTFLTIENSNIFIHCEHSIKSDRDSIRNSCDVYSKDDN